LRDLLRGEHIASGGEGLSHFIQIETDAAGTQLHISTRGRYDSPASKPQWYDPTIVLDGVDLRGDLGLSASASSADVINKLIAQGQLYLDP
ncbi:MAG: type I secretion C-terminal target domain-containing protein, partial [Aquabacterium sp.]|nr:type I secretion C-terminal target domain-containing protein [Aquabacterium sp.]